MITREAAIDTTKLAPNRYVVAQGCPKLLEGHEFYACALLAPAVPAQDKPALRVTCEHLVGPVAQSDYDRKMRICCSHGATARPPQAQFGIPTISHYAPEVNDGSEVD